MKYLVTGAAGFIGMHTSIRLLSEGHEVIGLDNLNDYYNSQLKIDRLAQLKPFENFRFIKADIADRDTIKTIFKSEKFQRVIHLAAQAGVRYSIENPLAYIDSNLVGMATVLEGCRHNDVEHLVYASSSSVYGANKKIPFSEEDPVDHPVSLYAATKKSNELMAHTYSHLYALPTTGLRFFTVYGPWGRPDMAPWLFTDAISKGNPIKVFNQGKMKRDFTYIDDIVEGVCRSAQTLPTQNESITTEGSPLAKVYNIGNNEPIELETFIASIENTLERKAEKVYLPMQDGDVPMTYADITKIGKATEFSPSTPIDKGIKRFVDWFKIYHNVKQK